MNDAMLKLFAEHEKIDGPPLGVTSEQLARRGCRRLVGHNVARAGGLTAVVALGVVAVLTVPNAFMAADPIPHSVGNANRAEQPEYPLPDPDELPQPPENYTWGYSGNTDDDMKTSEDADAYGYAFTDWFAANGDDDIIDWPGMAIKNRVLVTDDEDMEQVDGYFPYYGIVAVAATDGVAYGDERSIAGLLVHSRGTFKEGGGDTYQYLFTCTDGVEDDPGDLTNPDKIAYDYTCDEVTDDHGKYYTVKTVATSGGKTRSVMNQVFVFREDGTAVEVTSSIDGQDSVEAPKPKLDFDELADLARSMPDNRVGD